MTTRNLTQALRATCRLSSIPPQGLVHRRPLAVQLYWLLPRSAAQLQPLLFPPSALDPRVRHNKKTTHTHTGKRIHALCVFPSYNISFSFIYSQMLAQTGAETAASPLRCLNIKTGIYSIIHPCLTQDITVSEGKTWGYFLLNSSKPLLMTHIWSDSSHI